MTQVADSKQVTEVGTQAHGSTVRSDFAWVANRDFPKFAGLMPVNHRRTLERWGIDACSEAYRLNEHCGEGPTVMAIQSGIPVRSVSAAADAYRCFLTTRGSAIMELPTYFTECRWSDRVPWMVVAWVSRTEVVLRQMKVLDAGWRPDMVPGGFSGHCRNQHEQVWDIQPDPDGFTVTVRFSTAKCMRRNGSVGGWVQGKASTCNSVYVPVDVGGRPQAFTDLNF
jgi:hypothetical protein